MRGERYVRGQSRPEPRMRQPEIVTDQPALERALPRLGARPAFSPSTPSSSATTPTTRRSVWCRLRPTAASSSSTRRQTSTSAVSGTWSPTSPS